MTQDRTSPPPTVTPPDRPGRGCPARLADLDSERASFRLDVPEHFNGVRDIVETWAFEGPNALAVLSVNGAGDVIAEQSAADLARGTRGRSRAARRRSG